VTGKIPPKFKADLPVLFIGGVKDLTSSPKVAELMRELAPSLEIVWLEASHWILVEQGASERVTEEVLTWLGKLESSSKL
jgi:pimeloyl-ACP methyl ester carboxylesterase